MLRRRMFGIASLAGASFVACQYSTPEVIDAPLPDTGECLAANASCVGDTLRTCARPGASVIETSCSWGCESNGPAHCRRIAPTGGGVVPADLDPDNFAGVVSYSLAGTIDGGLGTINGTAASSLGIGYQLVNGIAVFRFKDLAVGVVRLTGSQPIALVADGPITIAGAIDVAGPCTTSPEIAGAGGGNGGTTSGADGQLLGGGAGGANTGLGGGGGGGYGGVGGVSGGGEFGGPSYGDDTITTLRGGGGGGAGKGIGSGSFVGGGGGGAIQLVSNTSIELAASGSINAGGGGGQRGVDVTDEGGGGGAGGTIVLEAPFVHLGATSALAVNGGGGGGAGGGTSHAGAAGGLTRTPAAGGTNGAGGAGGDGGAAAVPNGSPGLGGATAGGGGGAVGRIRINTRGGSATIDGVMSPAFGDPSSTATQGSATTQ